MDRIRDSFLSIYNKAAYVATANIYLNGNAALTFLSADLIGAFHALNTRELTQRNLLSSGRSD
jgi:hypothetical protein